MANIEVSTWNVHKSLGSAADSRGHSEQSFASFPLLRGIYCRGSLSVWQGSLYFSYLYTSKFQLVWLQNIFVNIALE